MTGSTNEEENKKLLGGGRNGLNGKHSETFESAEVTQPICNYTSMSGNPSCIFPDNGMLLIRLGGAVGRIRICKELG